MKAFRTKAIHSKVTLPTGIYRTPFMTLKAVIKVPLNALKQNLGHYSTLLRSIIACNQLPFFKIFSDFVHFCQNFQIFCTLSTVPCPFSEKLHSCPYILK